VYEFPERTSHVTWLIARLPVVFFDEHLYEQFYVKFCFGFARLLTGNEMSRVGLIYRSSTSLLEFPVGEGKLNVPPTPSLPRLVSSVFVDTAVCGIACTPG
jgi:hypothetical protein